MSDQNTVTYPQATVQLTGSDGNAFNIIGRVEHAIREDVGRDQAAAWVAEALRSESYDALLALCMRTLHVL